MAVKLRKYNSFFYFSVAKPAPLCEGHSRLGGEAPKRTGLKKSEKFASKPNRQFNLRQRMAAMAMKKKSKKKKAAKK
jgi:hypothetical protein